MSVRALWSVRLVTIRARFGPLFYRRLPAASCLLSPCKQGDDLRIGVRTGQGTMLTNPSLVSICIPAWERTDLLIEAVRSCLAQTCTDIEVVVADDSRSDKVASAMQAFASDSRVRYYRNPQRLGQSGNVNRLFDLARGSRLMLLHDDDALFPDAVEGLDRCWREYPGLIACYGKQYVIAHSGGDLPDATLDFDRSYHRTPERAGLQPSKLWAALVEQMPPDGAMIDTAAARAVRFRGADVVGDDCDYDFIARLAERPGEFFFVDRYITKYRLTDSGVASRKTVDHTFAIARDLQLPPELEDARRSILRSRAAYAVRCHVISGHRRAAWDLIRNDEYWTGPRSKPRVRSALIASMPATAVRVLDAARRFAGRTLRRSNGLSRLVARVKSTR
jgi:glycosyltransferase involved in cell wall biosynthesis